MTPEDVAAVFARQRELDPRVIDFARALAPATRIEVELVRHMRLELLPDSDAGLEANLWFSPLVAEIDMLGLSLVPECRDELRRQLTLPEHRETLALAWQVIDRCHRSDRDQAGIPPVVSLQEAITYHALAGPASETPREHRRLMQTSLGTLIKALDEDSEGSLASWIARALPALPELARTSAAAIALAEKVRAQDSSLVLENIPRASQQGAGASLSPNSTIDVGCQRRTDGIEFSVEPNAGSVVLRLPRTSPLAVEIQTPRFDGWQTRSIEFEPASEFVVSDPSPGSRCRITTATGHRLSLQPTFGSSPPALVVVGRLGQGSTLAAMRRAVADIGWTIERAGEDAPPRGRTARAVLLSAPESAEDVSRVDTRVTKRLVNSGAPLLAWTARGLEPVRDVRQAATPIAGTNMPVLAVRFSRDGSEFAVGGPTGIQLFDSTGTTPTTELRETPVFSLSFRPDGQQLALGSTDGTIWLWARTPRQNFGIRSVHTERVTSVEFSGSGQWLASTSADNSAAWLLDKERRRVTKVYHEAQVNHAVFSPDETMIATACEDGTVCLWEVESGRKISTLRHDAAARSVAWSAQGDRLVVATGSEARVWAAPALERGSSLAHDRPLQTAVLSRDGRRVATIDIEGIARIWHLASAAQIVPALDPAAGKNRRVPPLAAVHPPTPHGLAFAPDDRSLLVASSGQAFVWSTLTPTAPVSSIKGYLLDSVGTLKRLPAMEQDNLAALRRQLLAIDDRTLQAWEGRAVTAGEAPGVQAQSPDTAAAPPGVPERARRTAVAIIDDGIDVLHETFLDEDGRSRIVAIWDQKDTSGPNPEGFTYGRLHTAEDIAGYVRRQSVPEALGRNADGHGTHVASVAAGRRVGRFRGGQAPEAAIVAVVMRQDSPSILDALSFVDRTATRLQLPLAIGLSADLQAGSRDGKSLLEVGVDAITHGGRKPGRVIVSPAGNRREMRQHASVDVPTGVMASLAWSGEGDSVQLELWTAAANSYRFHLGGQTIEESNPQARGVFEPDTSFFIDLTKRHVDNGDSRLFIQLDNLAALGRSTRELQIVALRVTDTTPVQAWIDSGTGTFEFTRHASDRMTIAVPATVASVIAVGAASTDRRPYKAAQFSSLGPTRDGREKPDVSAPGIDIPGARGGTSSDVTQMSGTSMAAAQVTGIVALLLNEAGSLPDRWPTANQILGALRQTARGSDGGWDPALGYGVVDARAFIQSFSG